MTHKITIKNPHDITVVDRRDTVEYQVQETSSAPTETYSVENWDVEVTFTRKQPEIKAFDLVKHCDYTHIWQVIAIYQGLAWIIPVNPVFGTTPSTRHLDDLRPA